MHVIGEGRVRVFGISASLGFWGTCAFMGPIKALLSFKDVLMGIPKSDLLVVTMAIIHH